MSVWQVDLVDNQVVGKYKTGFQIGEKVEETEIVGGASPNSVAVGSRFAYISNATNDLISVLDYRRGKIVAEIPLSNFTKNAGVGRAERRIFQKKRGMMPFGLCLSNDEKTLFVALLGLNSVAVVDTKTRRVRGLIPTGWGTTRVAISKNDAQLFILSARGLGAGPNGGAGFIKPFQGTYIGDIQLGTFQKIMIPDSVELARYTHQAIGNTFVKTHKGLC